VKNTTKAHLAVLATNIFFAANYSLVKFISPVLVKPFALNILRVSLSLVFFWLVWLFGKTSAGIKKQHRMRFLLCALTGIAINQTLFIKGLILTSTVHASLLMLTTPLLITIFAFWLLREPLTIFKIAGLILGIGGSVFLVLNKEDTAYAENYLLGDMLILINAVSYTIYFILVKPLMQEYSPLHVVRWVFTLGLLMILPFGIVELNEIKWPDFELHHLGALAAVAFTGTFLAYYFNAYGIQHIGAGKTGAYIYTQPVFAVVIATILLNETITAYKLMAAVLIFAGVFLVNVKKNNGNENN
jgi:drug/metabolite transporter (DMT)-like permease